MARIKSLELKLKAQTAWSQTAYLLRKAAPGIVASFIVCLLIVIRPVSNWTGRYSFLGFPFLHLFFYPAPATVGAHFEAVLLGIFGAAIGLGISFLAVCGAIWVQDDGDGVYERPKARVIGAIVLVALSFGCAYIQSRLPRLKQAGRIALFVGIWSITTGAPRINAAIFLSLFWPALFAAVASLIANWLVFPHTGDQGVARLLLKHVSSLQEIVNVSVQAFFHAEGRSHGDHVPVTPEKLVELKQTHLASLLKMRATFHEAAYEISYGRITCRNYKKYLPIFRRLRAWVSCGMGLHGREAESPRQDVSSEKDSELPEIASLESTAKALTEQIVASLDCVKKTVELTLSVEEAPSRRSSIRALQSSTFAAAFGVPTKSDLESQVDRAVLLQRKRLKAAVQGFRDSLEKNFPSAQWQHVKQAAQAREESPTRAPEAPRTRVESEMEVGDTMIGAKIFDPQTYAVAFLMVSLLEIANECSALLLASQDQLRMWHAQPHKTIHFPLLSWTSWLGTATSHGNTSENLISALEKEGFAHEWSNGLENEDTDGLQQVFDTHLKSHRRGSGGEDSKASRRSKAHWWTSVSRSRLALKIRLWVSRRIRDFKHSRHIKHAFKLSAGVALLSIPAWIPGSPRQWFVANRGQWLVVSFVWCLETSTGATFQVSAYRLIGTIVGAFMGIIVWEVSRGNPYGLVVLVCAAELFSAYFIVCTKAVGVGIVYAVTYSIIAFIPYLGQPYRGIVKLAWNRGYMIFLGIVASLLINLIFWPYNARSKLADEIGAGTMELQTLYLSLSRQMLQSGLVPSKETAQEYERLEQNLQSRFARARSLVGLLSAEISLIPRPFEYYSDILNHLQSVADHLSVLRLCREHGLRSVRREAILNVVDLRREFISSVLVCLWIAGQSLRTHTPLPQFIPSSRVALEELTRALRQQLFDDENDAAPSGLTALRVHQRGRSDHRRAESTTSSLRRAAHANAFDSQQGKTTSSSLKFALSFLLAEHALLSEIVEQCEALIELCRALVGEATFLPTSFIAAPPMSPSSHHNSITHSATSSIILAELDRWHNKSQQQQQGQ